MTTLKTIHGSMFTKIKHYMLVLTKNKHAIEESHDDYKLFQFMCKLEMNHIYKALEGQRKESFMLHRYY